MESPIKYPIGIQTFEEIRSDDYVYVDKTKLVYDLVTKGKFYFLSRPRRFGKSLLVSTLDAYFQGRRDLFQGLAIDSLEKEWTQYPVFHLDLSSDSYINPEVLVAFLEDEVSKWEKVYGASASEKTVARRFGGVIERAFEQTGKKVVILVDEYDAPLVNVIHKPELLEANRETLSGFYKNLKSCDQYIKFAFLTGVTKFGNLSIFSALNNLQDISLWEEYQDICGITEDELHNYFDDGVAQMAEKHRISKDECYDRLKTMYDGYRFCEDGKSIYNPFSVFNALASMRFGSYWFQSGTPTALLLALRDTRAELTAIPGKRVSEDQLVNVNSYHDDLTALLYQSGYLTIKGVTATGAIVVDFPNNEVRTGFIKQLVPLYTSIKPDDTSTRADDLRQALFDGDTQTFVEEMRAMIAGIKYEFFEETEQAFQFIFYVTCVLIGGKDLRTDAEKRTNRGRMDMAIETPDWVYVIEFKINQSPEVALQQIHDKHYIDPWATDARGKILLGVNFSTEERNIPEVDGWKEERN